MDCIWANAKTDPCSAPAERVPDPNRLSGYSYRCAAGHRWADHEPAPSFVPMVADVLRVMREQDVDQDEAVRRLGGQP